MATTRWERFKAVQAEHGVSKGTLRRWINEGWVQSRREGPKLLYVLVYADGPAKGRAVGLEDSGELAAAAGA